MRYLRLFSVALLLSFAFTGCHSRRERAVPPPQAQAPIVTTLPPEPPLAFPNVELPKPKPATPVAKPAPPPQPKPQPVAKVHPRPIKHKAAPEKSAAATESASAAGEGADAQTGTIAGTAALGKLSADDAAADPHENVQTERLIHRTEARFKKLSRWQRTRHKDAVAQVASFLSQAKQAWAMNDVVGAQTLANKAKILLDEVVNNTLPTP